MKSRFTIGAGLVTAFFANPLLSDVPDFEPRNLNFAIQADDAHTQFLLVSISATVSILQAASSLEGETKKSGSDFPNYIFISESDVFLGGKINPEILSFLSGEIKNVFLSLNSTSERCFIQEVFPPLSIERTVFVFHNALDDEDDDVFNCYALGLKFFLTKEYDEELPRNWRDEIKSLISD